MNDNHNFFQKRIKEILSRTNMQSHKNTSNSNTLFCEQVKKLRKLNEMIDDENNVNKKTNYDQKREEEKFLNAFNDMNVHVKFTDLIITDDFIFWGGIINGVIQFIYKVTDDKQTSGIEYNYLENFSPDNPENDEIIKTIENYYNTFYQYWNNNLIQK
jgi:hypothetical protein